MKSFLSKLIQASLTFGQVFNQYSDLLPTKYKATVTVVFSAIQGLVGVIAHFYTPQGTLIVPIPNPPIVLEFEKKDNETVAEVKEIK